VFESVFHRKRAPRRRATGRQEGSRTFGLFRSPTVLESRESHASGASIRQVERAAEIGVERARAARRRAKRRLKRPTKDTDIARAEAALKRALLRLDIAEKSGRI